MSLLVRAGVEREDGRLRERNDAAEYSNFQTWSKPDPTRVKKSKRRCPRNYRTGSQFHNSYITALLKVAKAALMLETHFSSCTRIRSKTSHQYESEQNSIYVTSEAHKMLAWGLGLGQTRGGPWSCHWPMDEEGKKG